VNKQIGDASSRLCDWDVSGRCSEEITREESVANWMKMYCYISAIDVSSAIVNKSDVLIMNIN